MGLRAYYKFNGNANDYSGNGNNATAYNATYPNGLLNQSILFGSSYNGYLEKDATTFNYTTQNFTFSFWWKGLSWTTSGGTGRGTDPILLFQGNYGTNGYYAQIHSGDIVVVTSSPTAVVSDAQNLSISLNKWYHIGIVRNGSSVRIYLNGVDVTTTKGTHSNPASATIAFRLNSYTTGTNQIKGNVMYDEFKSEARNWAVAEMKNEFSRVKGFF